MQNPEKECKFSIFGQETASVRKKVLSSLHISGFGAVPRVLNVNAAAQKFLCATSDLSLK